MPVYLQNATSESLEAKTANMFINYSVSILRIGETIINNIAIIEEANLDNYIESAWTSVVEPFINDTIQDFADLLYNDHNRFVLVHEKVLSMQQELTNIIQAYLDLRDLPDPGSVRISTPRSARRRLIFDAPVEEEREVCRSLNMNDA